MAFTIVAGVDHASADQFLLHQQEDVLRNDRFMVALHIVLWDGAVVLDALLRKEVRGVGLLQECVTDVLLVPENLVDGAGVPFCFARAGENAVRFKPCGDLVHAQALQVFPVDAPDDFGLLRLNDKVAVRIFGVAEEAVVVDLHFALLVAVLDTELHILRKALAFLLGKGCHDGKQHLALGVHRVDGLFFKENRNVQILEFTDVFQAIQRVTGKSADRLGDDHVDISGMALFDHAVEFITLFGVRTCDSVVCEYARQHPFWILGDVFGVVLNLGLVAGGLLIAVSTDTAVRCDSELWLLSFFNVVPDLPFCRDDHYISHQLTSLSIRL